MCSKSGGTPVWEVLVPVGEPEVFASLDTARSAALVTFLSEPPLSDCCHDATQSYALMRGRYAATVESTVEPIARVTQSARSVSFIRA